MHVVTGPAGQPPLNVGMLVGGVDVDDEMDLERGGHVGVRVAQEGEEFLVARRRLHYASTAQVATSRAANSVAVPWRT